MELTHSFAVPASIDQAWALFMDLREVGECFPGATVTEVTDEGFTGQVKVRLGPIAMVYAGTGQITERDDASHRAVIDGRGKDKRGNGMAGATATIQLSQGDSGHTQVDVSTDLTITGKPAQFGRGVIQDISDKLLGQFISCIEGKLSTPRSADATADTLGAGDAGGAGAAGAAASDSTGSAGRASSGPGVESGAGRSDAPREPLTAAMFGATGSGFAGLGAGSGTSGSGPSGGSGGSGGSGRSDAGAPVSGEAPAPAAAPSPASPPPGLTSPGPDSGSGGRISGADGDSDDALDLGATVLPVVARAYAPHIGIGLAALWIGWKLGRKLPG